MLLFFSYESQLDLKHIQGDGWNLVTRIQI